MKIFSTLLMFSLFAFSHNVAAYGSSGSSKKACNKPKFSQFTPPHLSEVPPRSAFSFVASASTLPNSIKVTIKNNPVALVIDKKNSGYLVTGNLPASITNGHVRIKIIAMGPKKCKGNDGWLLKVVNE